MKEETTNNYDVVMPTPRSVRFEPATQEQLAAFVTRHAGLTQSSAAAMLVEEGLRMDAHPGVLFREGPAGRRAVLAGGPDVWEVIRAIRAARRAKPRAASAATLALVAEQTGVEPRLLEVAVAYYSDHPDEVDSFIAAADEAESAVGAALARRQSLLGA